MAIINTLEDPWYYLKNFEFVLNWIAQRYSDLLAQQDHEFIASFGNLPQASQGLLVRMIMRKGRLFRASKLQYVEIGSTPQAAQALLDCGLIAQNPAITIDELFRLLNKKELTQLFKSHLAASGTTTAKKASQLEYLRREFPAARCFSDWTSGEVALVADTVYCENVDALCERFRLMFFGNLRQDWSEFVLTDLGRYTYEKVDFSLSSRAFQSRDDIDAYLHLHRCKEQLAAAIVLNDTAHMTTLRNTVPPRFSNPWLEARRGKLLFQIGQYHERAHNWAGALDCYEAISHPGARGRKVRVLERAGFYDSAIVLAQTAQAAPESEAEHQLVSRMLPRLIRYTNGVKIARRRPRSVPQLTLVLPQSHNRLCVEEQVRDHINKPGAPAFYVENTLINSLFGLLFWDAVFAAVPGAFFHPFQQGPSDLLSADFYASRRPLFDAGFAQLDSGQYKETILRNFTVKSGLQCTFVAWGLITQELLTMALSCIPAKHLFIAFDRLKKDLRNNRSGLPDLIQFWPADRRYKMIEVKGPGDRLQDNQIRWLDYCQDHHIPVGVCYVQRPLMPEE